MADLRILSLGAGVQSSCLALMIEHGEIPMIDAAIFADTMGEPADVYKWLEKLKTLISFPLYIVSNGSLRKGLIQSNKGIYIRGTTIPLYTLNKVTGNKGILRRQCTVTFKIEPVKKQIRTLLGVQKGQRVPKDKSVKQLFGISLDEMIRMRSSPDKYITFEYPLIDQRMTRNDCLKWMDKHKYPRPAKSACTFCPYHSNKSWLKLKENKTEWDDVVELDKTIRSGLLGTRDELYLHKSRVPLDKAELEPDKDQLDLFDNVCDEGMCGV